MRIHLFFLIAISLVFPAMAAVTMPATPGKTLYENTFGAPQTNFKAGKGKWEIVDGAWRGTELAADKHGAVARMVFPFKEAMFTFDFKFTGGKLASLSINDSKDHVARLQLTPTGWRAQKDDHDHAGPEVAMPFNQVVASNLKDGWHSATLVLMGDLVWATVDGKDVSFGRDPLFKTGMANVGLTVSGDGVLFKNFKISEPVPNPAWTAAEADLRKQYPMPAPAAPKAAGAKTAGTEGKPAGKTSAKAGTAKAGSEKATTAKPAADSE